MLWPRCAAPGLLVALATVICGKAIHFQPSKEESGADGETLGVHGAGLTRTIDCSVAVPRLAVFRKAWEMMMSEQPPAPEVPEDDRPLLVVGVFTTAGCHDRPFRDIVRSTWMAQRGVCPLGRHTGPQAGCLLHVAFVAGQGGDGGEEMEHAEDMTVLPIQENMNCGKTPAWFQHASTEYPWATHIAKIDLDAFPYVPLLVDSIRTRAPSKCPNLIGGESHLDVQIEPNPFLRGYPEGGDFLKCRYGKPAGCWSYMQGGLYLLTTELARNASAPGRWWQKESEKCGPEDATAGKAINMYGLENNICVGALQFGWKQMYWHGRDHWREEEMNKAREEGR